MRRLAIAAWLVAPAAVHADPLAGAAAGAAAAPAPTTTVSATTEPAGTPKGLAVGVEVGDPIAVTAAFNTGSLMLAGAVGSATVESPGVTAHGDVQFVATRISPKAVLRLGVGVRYYRHSHLASPDELPSTHLGARLSSAFAVQAGAAEVYLEIAPGIDFLRTNSCNLADGAYSVCPHAQESPLFFEGVIGLRFFLSH